MFRMIGFLTGSALSGAALWLIIGGAAPDWLRNPAHDAPRVAEHALSLPTLQPTAPLPIPPAPQDDAPRPRIAPGAEVAPASAVLGSNGGSEPPAAAQAAVPAPPADQAPAQNGEPSAGAPERLATIGTEEVTAGVDPLELPGHVAPDILAAEQAPGGDTGAPDSVQWYPVWQPFHSELSAQGFARRLEQLTGLEYEVAQVKRGSFQVLLAFADEAERAARVAHIEATTGLALPAMAR